MKKILFLSNNDNTKVLYKWLVEKGYNVISLSTPITADDIDDFKPDFVICYNYSHIINENVISKVENKIINMHTSLLPWNKGASPNIWSFIDDTPKGVTIHRLEKGLDKGKIIFQKECFFDENVETLSSTYNKLNEMIVELLKDNWSSIEDGTFTLKDQVGHGSYHRTSDLKALLNGRQIDYSMTIAEFKSFIRE